MLKHLLLIALLTLAACSNEPQFPPLPKGANVLILGDSLSHGTGAAEGEDYPSLLAANTDWNIINAGVPGDTSAGGLQRLPGLLDRHEVDLLIVELGGNDFIRRVPQQETINNLRTILSEARANNIQPLLLAIPAFSPFGAAVGSLSDHELYRQLAKETDTPLVEDIFSDVLAKNALKSDPIHPNAEGYRLVEEGLRKALSKKGFLN
ncbi:MAG: arylesterase [Betaproteobacteria bacterium HGW-Betaproteobacteria-1]|jgi:acyl-CoA hydrolase|nr:MAG: arylesterase [Betaproteobacteria bacterium HGW-Betaproteobacteria-1]